MTNIHLDHFVIAVSDLESAGAAYEAMGFQVLPAAKHLKAGSRNRVIQFGRTYLELLGDIDNMIAPYDQLYAKRLQMGEGAANICFSSADLETDRERLAKLGVSSDPVKSAARPITMPDGSQTSTDSDFFYPHRPGHPYQSPFFAAHRKPETIFTPAYQSHENSVLDIVGVTCVSESPSEDLNHFAKLAAVDAPHSGTRLNLAHDHFIDIYSPEEAASRYGETVAFDCTWGGHTIGFTLEVASMEKALRTLKTGDVPYVLNDDGLFAPHNAACGAFLRFIERQR